MTIVNESFDSAVLGGSGTTITVTKPSGTVSGDVLVAIVKCHTNSITVTSSGWTVVKEDTISTLAVSMLYLVAGGSEPSDYIFTYSGTASQRSAIMYRLSGVDNSTPSDATATSDTFSSTADLLASAITTGNANAYLIEGVNNRQSRTQDASDITELNDIAAWGFAANGEIQSAAGSSGDKSSTLSASSNYSITILWALKEESGGTVYEQSAAGTLTTAGVYSLLVSLSYAGILSTAGDLVGQCQKALAGALSSAGAVSSIKIYLQALAGALTSAGALVSQGQKTLIGSLTSAGTLAKTTILTYAGTLTSSGTISAIKTFLQALAGTLTSAGARSKLSGTQLVGVLTSVGFVSKTTAVSYAGSLSSAGTVLKKTIRSYAGSLTSSGILSSIKNAVVETIDLTLNSRSVSFLLNARSTAFTLVQRAIDFTVGTRE